MWCYLCYQQPTVTIASRIGSLSSMLVVFNLVSIIALWRLVRSIETSHSSVAWRAVGEVSNVCVQ